MKHARIALALMAVLALATAAWAGESVTLHGKVVCAKCTLKKADAKECHNVLVVPDKDGKDVEYYLTKNKVDEKFGEVCTSTKKVIVTGTAEDREDKKWLTATSIENVKS